MTKHPPIDWSKVITPEAVAYARAVGKRTFGVREGYQRMCAATGCTPETCEWCKRYGPKPATT